MMVMQGFPVCEDTPDLTSEHLMDEQRFEAEFWEAKKQASKTDNHLHANGKKLKKKSNARPGRL
jgi:hypothetical protein